MGFPELFAARKEVDRFPGWTEPEAETGAMWFVAPLAIGGVTQEAFTLHGLALKYAPDRNVCFELRALGPRNRKVPLARYEWRSLRGGHTNSRRAGSPVSGERVTPTHYHSFNLNFLPEHRRMRSGNLPQAESVEADPQSFESLRVEVGNLFRINNMSIVFTPPWEYGMFGENG
jgi:hypothetical protein